MKTRDVKQINQRQKALTWWFEVLREHPMGVVPVSTASRILDVTPQRVRALIKEGRFTLVRDMPGGNSHDQFIPLDELIGAPFAMNRGQPSTFGPKNRPQHKKAKKYREYEMTLNDRAVKDLRKKQ